MIAIFVLAIATATIRPAAPTVGDLITIELETPVIVQPSPSYEIVAQHGKRVVVRTFEPKPFLLRGPNFTVPVRSVLSPADAQLQPAPLQPPRAGDAPKLPLILIAIAALLAALVWTAVLLRAKAEQPVMVPFAPPDTRFREIVVALRNDPRRRKRWAALADATRAYLAATRPHLGPELTTRELLVRAEDPIVREILTQGDLEKFSPWGAQPVDFDEVATRALELAA
ncbi:MAG TPA: hypothetical protein VN181_12235 [Thermoanaerobaculia bacterium]|nr:hypothetical protein [Thermoanaerobaculia bacterium]